MLYLPLNPYVYYTIPGGESALSITFKYNYFACILLSLMTHACKIINSTGLNFHFILHPWPWPIVLHSDRQNSEVDAK